MFFYNSLVFSNARLRLLHLLNISAYPVFAPNLNPRSTNCFLLSICYNLMVSGSLNPFLRTFIVDSIGKNGLMRLKRKKKWSRHSVHMRSFVDETIPLKLLLLAHTQHNHIRGHSSAFLAALYVPYVYVACERRLTQLSLVSSEARTEKTECYRRQTNLYVI